MSNGLKALNIIRNYDVITDYEKDETKKIEELLPNSIHIIEKLLKALEIIKEKDVSMYWLRNSKSVDEYNNFILIDKRHYQKLTQGEFDLLKEVLLCQ